MGFILTMALLVVVVVIVFAIKIPRAFEIRPRLQSRNGHRQQVPDEIQPLRVVALSGTSYSISQDPLCASSANVTVWPGASVGGRAGDTVLQHHRRVDVAL